MTDSVALLPEKKKQDFLILIGGDGLRFTVPKSFAGLSATLHALLDISDGQNEIVYQLPPDVDGTALAHVIEWLEYRTDNPVPNALCDPNVANRKPTYKPRIAGWDLEYCNRIKGNEHWAGIWPVMLAAHYLGCEQLICVIANLTRSILRGWNESEYFDFDAAKVREVFDLPNVYMPEQEEAIRKHIDTATQEIQDRKRMKNKND